MAVGGSSSNRRGYKGPKDGRKGLRGLGGSGGLGDSLLANEEDRAMMDAVTGRDVKDARQGKKGFSSNEWMRKGMNPRGGPSIKGGNRFTPLGSNNGPRKGGGGIAYRAKRGKIEPGTVSSIHVLRAFLQSRYNTSTRFLNLDSMAQDQSLLKAGIKPPGMEGAQPNVIPVVSKLIAEMFPDVLTISFANNRIRTVDTLSSLALYVPNLANLSLQHNDIHHLNDLNSLAGNRGKLAALRELILQDNPLASLYQDKMVDYQTEISKKFPSLTMLDQRPVTPLSNPVIQDSLLGKKETESATPVFPLAIQPSFFDSAPTKQTAFEFLSRFFEQFDNKRPSLLDLYHDQATFSISTIYESPLRMKKTDVEARASFKLYHDQTQTSKKRKSPHELKFVKGPGDIINVITKLPSTSHSLADATKFILDAFQIPGLTAVGGQMSMWITIHGEFSELPLNRTRSFDRSFLLVPSAPDSSAFRAGWPCHVLSDTLIIRLYSDPEAWSSETLSVQPVQTNTGTVTGPQLSDSARTEQALILSRETNLTLNFAIQALEENAWNLDAARQAFQRLHSAGGIPKEAFNA